MKKVKNKKWYKLLNLNKLKKKFELSFFRPIGAGKPFVKEDFGKSWADGNSDPGDTVEEASRDGSSGGKKEGENISVGDVKGSLKSQVKQVLTPSLQAVTFL